MNFWELFTKNYSRKAAVVIIAIAALTYIAVLQAEEGKVIDQALAELAIYGITLLGVLGITAQAILDWRKPKEDELEQGKKVNAPEEPAGPEG